MFWKTKAAYSSEFARRGEDAAVKFLLEAGLRILERNARAKHGEIDIIADDNGEIVIIEVKARRSNLFGEPEESVTKHKQQLVRRTAEILLREKKLLNRRIRFDVIAIRESRDKEITIEHYKNAF